MGVFFEQPWQRTSSSSPVSKVREASASFSRIASKWSARQLYRLRQDSRDKCNLEIQSHHEGVKRSFNGVLVEAQWIGKDQDLRYYLRAPTMAVAFVPATKLQDIQPQDRTRHLSQVLNNRGFVQFEQRLSESYPELNIACSSRERFAFMSRLMEDSGIYYYFEHDESDHKLSGGFESAHEPKLGGAALEFLGGRLATLSARTD